MGEVARRQARRAVEAQSGPVPERSEGGGLADDRLTAVAKGTYVLPR